MISLATVLAVCTFFRTNIVYITAIQFTEVSILIDRGSRKFMRIIIITTKDNRRTLKKDFDRRRIRTYARGPHLITMNLV
ncbi:hypothetical protein V1506DRAFT_110699 [Lipomyces tetrasporus]